MGKITSWARDANSPDGDIDFFCRDETFVRLETETTYIAADIFVLKGDVKL